MRRGVAFILLAAALVVLSGCFSAPTPGIAPSIDAPLMLPEDFVGAIPVTLDRPVFWAGPPLDPTRHVDVWGNRDNDACEDPARGGCPEFALDVAPGGARLRVAIDHPSLANWFGFELQDPAGNVIDDYPYRDGGLSSELFVESPMPGRYVVRLRPWNVPEPADPPYTLRAKLEASLPAPPPADASLLPNLRAEPPSEFTFRLPPVYVAGVWAPAPLPSVTGKEGSCLPDEIADEGARRCLRFTFGWGNTGLGPVDLHFSPFDDVAGTARVVQHVHRADGGFDEHEAGSYAYHRTHGHYHYDEIFTAELFHVADPMTGTLDPVGLAAKRGTCAHDIKIVEWDRFYQVPRGAADSGSDCGYEFGESPASGMRIGLSQGWADAYTWFMPSNYVEFEGQPDGLYVVRATANQNGFLTESDPSDNVGYAYIEVEGDDVKLIERGWGTDPWDPVRVVATR